MNRVVDTPEINKPFLLKACEADRPAIAFCIAESFEKDFAHLSNDSQKVAEAIASGIQIDKFYVVKVEDSIVAVMAISDALGRAIRTNLGAYIKSFGLIKGIIAKLMLRSELEKKLDYPITTGYVELVAVRKEFRHRGIATDMLQSAMEMADYDDFVLDVTDVNLPAIQCYINLGYQEFQRVKVRYAKQKGFNEKIFMRYKKTTTSILKNNPLIIPIESS